MELKPQTPCARCGHGYSLHGKGQTPCQAGGCKGGPDGTRCPGYVAPAEAPGDDEHLAESPDEVVASIRGT